MKLVLPAYSPNSSVYSSELDTLDHYFRVSNLPALKHLFDSNPEKLNHKDPKVINTKLGWTPLYRAVIFGSLEMTQYLLESSALVNEPNNLGETPLHQATENKLFDIIELLLQYQADPNLQQADGSTSLHNAVRHSSVEITEVLLKHGADPNIQEFIFGKTPLHIAVENQSQEIINLLVNANADSSICDYNGKPADIRLSNYVNDESSDEMPAKAQQVYTLSAYEDRDSLYLWLKKHKLDEVFSVLVKNGCSDVPTLVSKMLSEGDLVKMRIKRRGIRLRLLAKIKEETRDRCEVSVKSKYRQIPELKSWMEESQMMESYETLAKHGFFYVDDLVNLENQQKLNEVLSEIGIKDKDIFKIGVMLYKLSNESGERGFDMITRQSEKGKVGDCGFCCAFKSFFS